MTYGLTFWVEILDIGGYRITNNKLMLPIIGKPWEVGWEAEHDLGGTLSPT